VLEVVSETSLQTGQLWLFIRLGTNLCFRHSVQKDPDIHDTPLAVVIVVPSQE
jgi:hypothetical protein